MGPRESEKAPRGARIALRRSQGGYLGLKMAPGKVQDGPKTAQDGPQKAPRRPKWISR